MRYYFAPMEGLTDSVFRRLHQKYFPGVNRYYMPFFSPTVHRALTHKEQRELPKADSVPFSAVPQVLTKSAEDFLWAARVCRDLGYDEVNLNLGCPSGTVVAKGKGSGMLRSPEELDRFLDTVFQNSPLPVSVKTRIGLERAEEFPALMTVFNRYPIRELTVHPRVRKQFYDGPVDQTAFAYAVAYSQNPLCYNGDIHTLAQTEALPEQYPGLSAVMIGRGLLANPGMLSGGTDVRALEAFMNELLAVYEQEFGGSRNAMFRLKEHWSYLRRSFPGSEKLWKALRKTTDPNQFRSITGELFHTLPFTPASEEE